MKITNVMAVSVDGKIASHPLEPDRQRREYGFTSDVDRAHVEGLLKTADAVVLGANSVRATGGVWAVENRAGRCATWVVMTNSGLPANLRFWQQEEVERWLVSKQPLGKDQSVSGVVNYAYGEESPAKFAIDKLRAAGAENVLLFGGGQINRLFYAENMVDELKVTVCPIILAGKDNAVLVQPDLPKPASLRLLTSNLTGNFVFLSYKVLKN